MEESGTGIPVEKIDKEGPLQLYNNNKKKWTTRWVILCGSALYYQKKKGDDRILGVVSIKDTTLSISTDHPNPKKKKIVIKLDTPSTSLPPDTTDSDILFPLYIAVADEDTRTCWINSINDNKNKEYIDIVTRAKQSTTMRVKRNVSSAVVTTSAGKDVIRKFVGKKPVQSIEIVKELVTKFEDKKKATDIENAIIKIAVKAILLWQNKDIVEDDITDIVPLVRNLWIDILNYCQMPFTYDPQCIRTHASSLIVAFNTVLGPYVSEKTTHLLRETVMYVTTKEFLDTIFEGEQQEELRKEIAGLLNSEWAKSRFSSQ